MAKTFTVNFANLYEDIIEGAKKNNQSVSKYVRNRLGEKKSSKTVDTNFHLDGEI